jgi:hypothetical protein
MFAAMETVKYSGGDWDDHLAAQVSALPSRDKFPGITSEEMGMIEDAYSCPRAASDMLAALHVEVDGLTPSGQLMLDKKIQEEIDKLQAVIDALKKMKVFQGTLKDKYWGSAAFADLDELSDVKHDHIIDQFIDDHTGIHMSTDIVKISYTIDLRQ